MISLDEARRRRLGRDPERPAAMEDSEDGARRERAARQLHALHGALRCGRLRAGELLDMIKLGVVTQSEEQLPCASPTRHESYAAWAARYYAPPGAGPGKRPPDANQVGCPLLCLSRRGAAPCVEALRARRDDDLVARAELRPCVVLGRELYLAIMLPVWLRQEDE